MSLEQYRWDAWNCQRCSNCKWVNPWEVKSARFAKICPSSARYLFDAYSCQGRMDIAKNILEGWLDYKDSSELIDIVYKCTLCGACDAMCKYYKDLEPLLVFEELRAKLVEDGQGPLPEHKSFIDSIKNYDNVWLQPRAKRSTWTKGLQIKDINREKADVLYFAGCTYSYKTSFQRVPQSTVTILKNTGVDFGILGNKEGCCGSPVLKVGDRKLFEKIARENIKKFHELGVSKVITSCAGCYSTFKVDYPQVAEMKFEVLHAVEYLNQLIEERILRFSKEVPLVVTYHDPCHLGRRGEPYIPWEGKRVAFYRLDPPKEFRRGTYGVYDPPRNVLKSIPGVELIEMQRIKEYSWCCGSGGGVKSAFPDFAMWTARERVEEAKGTGAEALVTCCPWCEANINDAIQADEEKIKLYDVVDLVLQAL